MRTPIQTCNGSAHPHLQCRIIRTIIIRKYHNSLLKTVFLYLIPCVLAGCRWTHCHPMSFRSWNLPYFYFYLVAQPNAGKNVSSHTGTPLLTCSGTARPHSQCRIIIIIIMKAVTVPLTRYRKQCFCLRTSNISNLIVSFIEH